MPDACTSSASDKLHCLQFGGCCHTQAQTCTQTGACVLTCTSNAFDLQVEGCWPPFLRTKQTCAFRLYRKQATLKQPSLDESLRALATLLCSISRMTYLYTTASCACCTEAVIIQESTSCASQHMPALIETFQISKDLMVSCVA